MKVKYLISFVCIAGMLGCVSTGQITALDQRIYQLEEKNTALDKALKDSEEKTSRLNAALATYRQSREQADQGLRSQAAGLYATVNELHREIQIVTGRLEEADYSIEKSRKNISTTVQEKENRLNRIEEIGRLNKERIVRIEQYLDFETSINDLKRADDSKQPAVAKQPKELPEAELYMAAKLAFDKGEYEVAREQFLLFLTRFPKSDNADNAQFWIGEIYYREKWYEKAIMEYQKVIETYPDGNKVPSALLKQGLAFFNLEEKANARLILKEMIRKYPSSNEAKIAKEKLNTLK